MTVGSSSTTKPQVFICCWWALHSSTHGGASLRTQVLRQGSHGTRVRISSRRRQHWLQHVVQSLADCVTVPALLLLLLLLPRTVCADAEYCVCWRMSHGGIRLQRRVF